MSAGSVPLWQIDGSLLRAPGWVLDWVAKFKMVNLREPKMCLNTASAFKDEPVVPIEPIDLIGEVTQAQLDAAALTEAAQLTGANQIPSAIPVDQMTQRLSMRTAWWATGMTQQNRRYRAYVAHDILAKLKAAGEKLLEAERAAEEENKDRVMQEDEEEYRK